MPLPQMKMLLPDIAKLLPDIAKLLPCLHQIFSVADRMPASHVGESRDVNRQSLHSIAFHHITFNPNYARPAVVEYKQHIPVRLDSRREDKVTEGRHRLAGRRFESTEQLFVVVHPSTLRLRSCAPRNSPSGWLLTAGSRRLLVPEPQIHV
ncbi:hypothetical protein EJ06DRAFT_345881 [Trichodelitschia bisporula]|uniref:Uncharacterized protein n=1 Tax=Trichodelitschia bisporula TaxID=703511 RepID=A0A6G1I3D6_9PEZI|nr:hypothetical protein EJ06DRAFT_345881 [Trichodelitschia bisporula]